MFNEYRIKNSSTHLLIQQTLYDIQSVRIYIEKQSFIHRQFEFAVHYM